MVSAAVVSAALLLVWGVMMSSGENQRPVIGLMFQRTNAKISPQYGETYIERAYIDYIESAGALTVPIQVDQSDEYYEDLMSKINGVLFPGGGVNLITSGYAKAGRKIVEMAMKANDRGEFFPLWGTCLGSEFLMTTAAGEEVYSKCSTENVMLPLQLTPGAEKSRMLKDMPANLLHILTTYNVTANYHVMCLEPKIYEKTAKLKNFYNVLSTNRDINGLQFVSMFEGRKYPFYATQWHPEKNIFLWRPSYPLNHSTGAVRIAQYFANFFVDEARKSYNKYPDNETLSQAVFYNLPTVYLGLPSMLVNYYQNLTATLSWCDKHMSLCGWGIYVSQRLSWFLLGVLLTTLAHFCVGKRRGGKGALSRGTQHSRDSSLDKLLVVSPEDYEWDDDMKLPLHK